MRRLLYGGGLLLLAVAASSRPTPPALSQAAPAVQTAPARTKEEPKLVRDFFVDTDKLSYGGYDLFKLGKRVRYGRPPESKSAPGMVGVSYAVLKKGGRELARFDGVYSGLGNETEFGLFPLLGGGARQMIVSQTVPRGGRHWVVSLSPRFRVIYDSAEYGLGREEMSVLDVDGDGVYEISQELTTFVFFEKITAGASHVIDILLKYDGGAKKYLPASHVHRDYTLGGGAASPSPNDKRASASEVLRAMLPHIYAGSRERAWELYGREYAGPDKERLRAKILAALEADAVYRYIYRRPRPGGRRSGAGK
jgi:hypothetical protein